MMQQQLLLLLRAVALKQHYSSPSATSSSLLREWCCIGTLRLSNYKCCCWCGAVYRGCCCVWTCVRAASQAQSVCYELASRESMSLSFRSKLAAHASSLFAAAAQGLQAAQQRAPTEASIMPCKADSCCSFSSCCCCTCCCLRCCCLSRCCVCCGLLVVPCLMLLQRCRGAANLQLPLH